MVIQREKISVWTDQYRYGKITKTIYFDYRLVVSFNPDKINERKLAAVQLVELGFCNPKSAGLICGFHRNTVYKLLRTKKLLGLEALFEDDRGPKTAWKYIGNIRETIKKLLNKYPDWTDQQIADAAAEALERTISRSAVARIRTEKDQPDVEKLQKHDL